MADKEKVKKDLETLRSTVSTSLGLLTRFQKSLTPTENVASSNADVNALNLAYDAASLVRAHSTKLSLLMINKPFTPSAINGVLRDITAGPIPALATAVQLCDANEYTKIFRIELQWCVEQIFGKLELLIREIPLGDEALKNAHAKTEKKAQPPASTGLVWEACDSVLGLKKLGVAGFLIKKAEQYRDMVKDALEELQEWGEEESDEDEDGENSDDEFVHDDPQDFIDDMFGAQRHIPRNDTQNFRERLQSSLRRLKLMMLMYHAVIKRRLKTLQAFPLKRNKNEKEPQISSCLDEVMKLLKKIPEVTDELANAFYELNTTSIDKYMDECFVTGFAAVELLVENWDGQKDEFSKWAHNFQVAIKKP